MHTLSDKIALIIEQKYQFSEDYYSLQEPAKLALINSVNDWLQTSPCLYNSREGTVQ
ncbi:hypothetical protein CWATWH0402_3455 [Crocosphaera watsonii WH 0402]|uniref:Uncharacterized protein n=1 Tax=Crocosphaera watsonii WH 0402 TaxID=1284629 RepID=T2JYH4_CROWT|nr:hypothetical protein CWATWH0402_3455 [Crocosphaera watsonii WH 0402]